MNDQIMLANESIESVGATGVPETQTETKFMQEYRVAHPAPAGNEIVAIRNGGGQVEIFTVGAGGKVLNLYPDSGSDTGYGMIETGLVGSAVAVGLDNAQRLIVFAVNKDNQLVLNYVRETGQDGANRWGTVQTASVNVYSGTPCDIPKIYTQEISGELYVGVLIDTRGNVAYFSYAKVGADWDGQFRPTSLLLGKSTDGYHGHWMRREHGWAYFIGFEVTQARAKTYDVLSTWKPSFSFTLPAPCTRILSSEGLSFFGLTKPTAVFGYNLFILDDHNLYRWNDDQSWVQISNNIPARQVLAQIDSAGVSHVFVLGMDAVVYHLTMTSPGSGWSVPAAIKGDYA